MPEDVATDDFDPQPVVEFCELVAGQDYAVSERVQRGITSRGFSHGVYPAKRRVRPSLQRVLPHGDGSRTVDAASPPDVGALG